MTYNGKTCQISRTKAARTTACNKAIDKYNAENPQGNCYSCLENYYCEFLEGDFNECVEENMPSDYSWGSDDASEGVEGEGY